MTRSTTDMPERRLIVLGSTGSIGVSTLDVVEHLTRNKFAAFDVVGLAAGSNDRLLCEQAKRFAVGHVAVADGDRASCVSEVESVFTGPNAARELIDVVAQPGDLVVGAMVGSAGLPATLAAIERGCDIALANKETLVAAGSLVMPLARKHDVHLLPVDSEHSAVAQSLRSGRSIEEVKRIVLTASGGPFRTWTKDRIANATVAEALNHPTWNMGRKVTIDSALMMNKALEVIEAHWLFGLPAEQIEVVVHPQSIIHSFVEYVDGSVIAQLGPPDMRTPIQYALTWPRRLEGCSRAMDWTKLRQMDFEPVNHDRFPAVQLALEVIRSAGTSGTVFNAANEAAVEAFLDERIPCGRVVELVRQALDHLEPAPVASLSDVLDADAAARSFVTDRIDAPSRPAPTAEPSTAR